MISIKGKNENGNQEDLVLEKNEDGKSENIVLNKNNANNINYRNSNGLYNNGIAYVSNLDLIGNSFGNRKVKLKTLTIKITLLFK